MWKQLLIASMMGLLVACGSQKSVKPPIPQAMGLLKVTITGIGEGASPTATAQWVQSVGTSSGVSSQAATVVPVNGSSNLGDVQLIRRLVSFEDDDLAGKRFVRATFDIVNRSTTAFNNLTLYAVNVPGNLGGTGITGLTSGAGVAITDAGVARGFKPTHGMRPTVSSLKVNEDLADLQFFTPSEAADVQNQGLTTLNPFNPPNNILPTGSTVLEYGFIARNLSGGRAIASPNTSTPSNCTDNSCKGTVTLAYQFPKVSPRSANPFSFSLFFLVVNETNQIASQSLEEQAANTIMGINSFPGFLQFRTLAGSIFGPAEDKLNPLCRVKTAIGPDAFLGPDPLPSVPGSLDVCFGASGKRATGIGTGDDEAQSLAIQPNGKIVVAGYSRVGSNFDFALARYNTNGSLDTSFDTDGKVTTAIGSGNDFAQSLAIQADGKIVVAGYSSNGSNFDFALARYNSNGSLDTSFDGDGKVTTAIGTGTDEAYSLAIYPDDGGPNANKIVVAGYSRASNNDFALVRYNTNGSLDSTFGTGGKVTTAIGSSNDEANSLAIYPNDGSSNANKIVVAGYSLIGSHDDFALVRYNTNGSLDTSFDGDGKVTTAIGPLGDVATSIAIQADDKIVAGGYSSNGSNDDFALVGYNTDGSLDTSFDTDGKVTTPIGPGSDQAHSLAIQSDGKIVLVGRSDNGSNTDIALVRYNSGGSLDTSFDTDGKVTTVFGLGADFAQSLAIQSDDKIVLAGRSILGFDTDFALARYNP